MTDKAQTRQNLVWRKSDRVTRQVQGACHDLGRRYDVDPTVHYIETGDVPTWRLLNHTGGLSTIYVRLVVLKTKTFLEVTGQDPTYPSECVGEDWLVDRLRRTTGMKVGHWKGGRYITEEPIWAWWQYPTLWGLVAGIALLIGAMWWERFGPDLIFWVLVAACVVSIFLILFTRRSNNN
jgi:hypothetical protein